MKKIALFLLLVILCIPLVSCGSSTSKSDKTGSSDNSWDDIKAKGTIVMGVDDSFPPMGFRDENGNIVGFDIDLANAVGKKLGVEIDVKPIDWSSKEAELMAGNIDVIWNGYTITDERKEKVAFTDPYLANRQVIITKKDYGVSKKADLENVKVGVQSMSSALDAIAADSLYDKIKSNLMEYENNTTAMLDLDAGNVKAVVMDEVVADYYISKHGGSYVILDENFGSEEYGVGVRKEDSAFLGKLQSALNELKTDGTTAEVSEKWFGADKILKK